MKGIVCKKDWIMDGKLGYKAGKKYKVLKTDAIDFEHDKCCVLLQSDQEIKTFRGWFWFGSDYFDVKSWWEENING